MVYLDSVSLATFVSLVFIVYYQVYGKYKKSYSMSDLTLLVTNC